MADILQTIQAFIAPVLHRVRSLASRGVVRSSNDSTRALSLSLAVLSRESMAEVERFAHFGLTSRPPAGAEVIVVCLGGSRDHPVTIAEEDRRTRPTGALEEGETIVYAVSGAAVVARIHLRANGSVDILAAGGVVVSDALQVGGDVTAAGNVSADGEVSDALGTLDALRQAYNVHTHTDPQGGFSGPPNPTV